MPLSFDQSTAKLEGVVTAEDAQPLHEWLLSAAGARLDLGDATHLHAAALQVLLAAGAAVERAPADPFLAAWIAPLLLGARAATEAHAT